MSIRPTTRVGYRLGARPHKWRVGQLLDRAGTTNLEKFLSSREPRRMAGSRINAELVEPDSLPAPFVKGDQYLTQDEIDFQSKRLDPDNLDPKEYG